MLNNILKTLVIILTLIYVNNVSAEQLLQSGTSWDGGSIFYPKGQAQVTSLKIKLEAGHSTEFHCHPVPTFGYILKGNLQVETKDGKKILMKQGSSILEVMKTVHRGTAIDSEVEIVVFYAGAQSVPNTVLFDSDMAKDYCY
ncbi:MAG: cupin domain-containing protein [Alcanivoracaceae bacterium]|nr:cupin domain-containing protein [Alcanivoracaceae bacterium]